MHSRGRTLNTARMKDRATKESVAMEEMYEPHRTIHAREVSGTFARLRILSVWLLLGFYYVMPWLTWDGRQAILLDLPARKFYILGVVLWPQDFVFLSWLLIIAALTLFYFTALAGRIWCGYACPQTVWTEAFMWLERWTEGPRNRRIKLDNAPWSKEKVLRRSAKHILWLAFAIWTGYTFVGFFSPIRELGMDFASGQLSGWQSFWIFFYGLATYGNAGFLREQVCLHMCPYARFQSAMFDKDTLIISYDKARGEPRGKRRKSADHLKEGLGSCINCLQCVHACPTGIDIRNGLQYECIACAACIDICDEIMDAMNYPRGLIKYTTQHATGGRQTKIIRIRTVLYTVLWLGLIIGFLIAINSRVPLLVDVLRDRNALYRELPGGMVENVYTLKIMNKGQAKQKYSVAVQGIEGMVLDPLLPIVDVPEGQLKPLIIRARAPSSSLDRPGYTIQFVIDAIDNPGISRTEDARFLAPVR